MKAKSGDRVRVSGEVYYGDKWYRVATEGTVMVIRTKSCLVCLDHIDGDGGATCVVKNKYITEVLT
jgi:hypothetical protein